MTHTSLLKLFILGCLCVIGATNAHAATLRTTGVESINSIRLESATSSVITDQKGQPVGFFAITFSIEAFETPIAIPTKTSRSDAAIVNYPIEYTFSGRDQGVIDTGYAAAVLVSENSTGTDAYVIPTGKRHTFTLYAVHGDTAKNRSDERMTVTGLPFWVVGTTKPIRLNPSEVQELKTPFALLSE